MRALPGFTSRISSPRRRSAGTWAGRFSCPPRWRSTRSSPRASRPMRATYPPSWSHTPTFCMFELARGYKAQHMTAYVKLQQAEFAAESSGYTATRHQREVGAGYFDAVTSVVTGGNSSITALTGSTEEQQFAAAPEPAGQRLGKRVS